MIQIHANARAKTYILSLMHACSNSLSLARARTHAHGHAQTLGYHACENRVICSLHVCACVGERGKRTQIQEREKEKAYVSKHV